MNTLLQNKRNMEISNRAEDKSLTAHSALQALQELKKKLAVSSVLRYYCAGNSLLTFS